MSEHHDLGDGFAYSFTSWNPDRRLNPQYEGISDVEKVGIQLHKDGIPIGHCYFDTPEVRAIPGIAAAARWQLISLEPLHLEPSIQTHEHTYGGTPVAAYHGWIRKGRWESA